MIWLVLVVLLVNPAITLLLIRRERHKQDAAILRGVCDALAAPMRAPKYQASPEYQAVSDELRRQFP